MNKIIASLSLLIGMAAAQTAPAAKPRITVDVRPQALPTTQEVESFLARWVGQDPTVKYQVLGISASEVPGVAKVVVQVGANQPPTTLYVTPDREHAIVGEVIQYGANPFAPARRKLDAQAKGPRSGSPQPRVTIVEFSDLQCPHCKNAQPIIDRLVAEVPGAQVIFQPFPLSNHDWASKAALTGECVAEQNPIAFFSYVHEVFAQQDQITAATAPEKLAAIASGVKADPNALKACLAKPQTAQKVQTSIDLGMSLGVSSTPTVFVNGRKLLSVAGIPYEQLKKLVEFEASQK